MIPAQYYSTVYLTIITILSLFAFGRYGKYGSERLLDRNKEPIIPSFFLFAFMMLFIGFRPVSHVFVDMAGTAAEFAFWDMGTYSFRWDAENLLYDNLRIYMATTHIPVEHFFKLIALIYFGTMYIACRRLFPRDTFFAYLTFLAAFSTFTYGTNGIKAGSAASIFMLALAYRDKPIVTAVLALVSLGFHHSMIMVVASYLIVYIHHKPKWYFALWVFSLAVAALHIGVFQSVFQSMADERGANYLAEQQFGKGFRIDFILYGAMPVLIGYYAIYKKKIQSNTYNIILCMYLMTNSIWMLCMYAEFTNRIAYLSWFQYPVVLIYPFLKERWSPSQYPTVMKIAFAHLAFTLLLSFIYK